MFAIFFPLVLFSQQKELISLSDKSCLSFINITGNTNINNFEFKMDFSTNGDVVKSHEIVNVSDREKSEIFEIFIPVKNFETNNKLIYRDFLELLQAEKYPEIIIGIPYSQLQKFLSGQSDSISEMRITIAGVTRKYNIPGLVSSCPAGNLFINGIKNIKLTDFNLDPPEKFQGLIKVKNQVKINFGFVLLSQTNV
jgi:hypothetical protein